MFDDNGYYSDIPKWYTAYGERQGGGVETFGFGGQFGYQEDWMTGLILCTNRYYDPQTGRWLTRDPIGYDGGENVYAYCLGNPIIGIDPSGTKIVVAPGYQKQYNEAKAYLTRNNAHAKLVFDLLEKMPTTIYIDAANASNQDLNMELDNFDYSYPRVGRGYILTWAPNAAVYFNDTLNHGYISYGSISPALALYHELIHAYHFFFEKGLHQSRCNKNYPAGSPLARYDNAEEMEAVKEERKLAATLPGEGLRYSHQGAFFLVSGVTKR